MNKQTKICSVIQNVCALFNKDLPRLLQNKVCRVMKKNIIFTFFFTHGSF